MNANSCEHVGERACQLLRICQVDALVGTVSICLGPDESKCYHRGLGIHLLKLRHQWDRTSHTVTFAFVTIKEVPTCLINCVLEPWCHLFHTPALTRVVSRKCDLSIVRNILGQLLFNHISTASVLFLSSRLQCPYFTSI